jgi:hypothetical protein
MKTARPLEFACPLPNCRFLRLPADVISPLLVPSSCDRFSLSTMSGTCLHVKPLVGPVVSLTDVDGSEPIGALVHRALGLCDSDAVGGESDRGLVYCGRLLESSLPVSECALPCGATVHEVLLRGSSVPPPDVSEDDYRKWMADARGPGTHVRCALPPTLRRYCPFDCTYAAPLLLCVVIHQTRSATVSRCLSRR